MTGFRGACPLQERHPRLGSAFPANKEQLGQTSVRSESFRNRRAAGQPGLQMRIACIHGPKRLYPAAVRPMPILVPRAIMQTSAATARDGARRDGMAVTPSTVRRLAGSAPSYARSRLSSPAPLRTPPRRWPRMRVRSRLPSPAPHRHQLPAGLGPHIRPRHPSPAPRR